MSDIPVIEPPSAAPDPKPTRRGRPPGRKRHARVSGSAQVGVGASPPTPPRTEPTRAMEGGGGEITRRSLADRQTNRFDVPVYLQKPGWSYRFVTTSVYLERVDAAELMDAYESGWRECRAEDFPGLVMPGTPPGDPVERYGQRLVMRPARLSAEADAEAYQRARQQEWDRMRMASTGSDAKGNEPGLSNLRGIQVRGASLEVQLAAGAGPIQHKGGVPG